MNVLGMAIADTDSKPCRCASGSVVSGGLGTAAVGCSVRVTFNCSTAVGLVADFFAGVGAVTSAKAGNKRIPQSIFTAPRQAVVGFLPRSIQRGRQRPDRRSQGGMQRPSRHRIQRPCPRCPADLTEFRHCQRHPIASPGGIALLPNSVRAAASYATEAQYEVIIDKANRDRFAVEIGFLQNRKQEHLDQWIAAKKRKSA